MYSLLTSPRRGTTVCAAALVFYSASLVKARGEPLPHAEIASQVNSALSPRQSELVVLDVNRTPGRPVHVEVPRPDNGVWTLDLQPYSIRAPDYKLYEQRADALGQGLPSGVSGATATSASSLTLHSAALASWPFPGSALSHASYSATSASTHRLCHPAGTPCAVECTRSASTSSGSASVKRFRPVSTCPSPFRALPVDQ